MAASTLVARLTRRWRKNSCNITEHDPSFKAVYLGNTITQWAKGSGSVDKPLATLWRNYCQSTKPDIEMHLTIALSGLKATTREHGLTEYWSHRVTYVLAHPSYPKLFCWVYRHEGRKMKPELRCHAVLCSSESKAQLMQKLLTERLHQALVDFRKEKQLRQNARLSVVSVLYPSTPRRKVVLSDGGSNYRPPLERSKSAPKLSSIEEDLEGEARAARDEASQTGVKAKRAPAPSMAARPRALSEPLVPPPSVSSDPGAGVSDCDEVSSDSESDVASEASGASIPSDPTADSDCQTPPPPTGYRDSSTCRLSPTLLETSLDHSPQLVHRTSASLALASEDSDGSTSDESGYAEEVGRPA